MKLSGKSKPGAPSPAGAQPSFQPIDRVNLLGLLDRIVNNGEACVVRLREPRGTWTYAFQGGGLVHASGGAVRGARQAFDLLWEFQQGEVSLSAGADPSLGSNLYIDKGRLVEMIRRSQSSLQGPGSPYIPPDQQRPIAPVNQPWSPAGQRPPAPPPGWNPAPYPQAYPAPPGYPQASPPAYPAQQPGYPAGGPQPYQPPPGYPQAYPGQAPYQVPPAAQPPARPPQPPQPWPAYPAQAPQAPLPPQPYPPMGAPPMPPQAPPRPMAPPPPQAMPQRPPQPMAPPAPPRPQPRSATPPSFSVPPMPLPKPRGTVNLPGRSAPPPPPAPIAPPSPAPQAAAGPVTPVDELKTLRATLVSHAPAAQPQAPPANWQVRGPGGPVAPPPAPAKGRGRAPKVPKAPGVSKPSPFRAWARVKLITFLLWACERRYSEDDHWTVKDAFEVATLELRDQFIGAFSQLGQGAKTSQPENDEFSGDQIASGRSRGRSRGRRR